jgi:hypothetical protein
MAHFNGRKAMFVVLRIVVASGTCGIRGGAVTKLVDVDGLLGIGIETFNGAGDMDFAIRERFKSDDPACLTAGCGMEDSDG